MANVISIEFEVLAAKNYDGDMPNWAYIDSTTDAVAAKAMLDSVSGYPIVRFNVKSKFDDGTMTEVDVFNGGLVEYKLIDGLYHKQ